MTIVAFATVTLVVSLLYNRKNCLELEYCINHAN